VTHLRWKKKCQLRIPMLSNFCVCCVFFLLLSNFILLLFAQLFYSKHYFQLWGLYFFFFSFAINMIDFHLISHILLATHTTLWFSTYLYLFCSYILSKNYTFIAYTQYQSLSCNYSRTTGVHFNFRFRTVFYFFLTLCF
jgi:uncharacterized membrane protein